VHRGDRGRYGARGDVVSGKTTDGGAAFPRPPYANSDAGYFADGSEGMSLREWYVGQVLSSGVCMPPWKRGGGPSPDEQFAKDVCSLADAILAELGHEVAS